MLVGPTDVGKSTVARILLNYAVRVGRTPLYVDLDIGQGSLAIPGTISAVLVEQPSPPNEFFVQKAPLSYHYGSANMAANVKLYKELCRVMAASVQSRFENSKKVSPPSRSFFPIQLRTFSNLGIVNTHVKTEVSWLGLRRRS
jgi:polyribonucleotide 5'-hydroxyl-kinase